MHYFELLDAQCRHFPDGSIRAFAPVPKRWSEIDAYLRREEQSSREHVETAIFQFIARGTWPEDIIEKERVFIRGRLNFGKGTALRFSVPLTSSLQAPETPKDSDTHDILTWLLLTQWEVLGWTEWMADLEAIYRINHTDSRSGQKQSSDWFTFSRREIRPPGF